MAQNTIQQRWQRFKVWWMRFFGVEAPEDESDYWRGFREGQAAVEPLIKFLARKIPD